MPSGTNFSEVETFSWNIYLQNYSPPTLLRPNPCLYKICNFCLDIVLLLLALLQFQLKYFQALWSWPLAAIALAISPENLIPPSAMTGTSCSFKADTTLAIAEICGTPTPVTILVVHIEPGPMPTFNCNLHQLLLILRLLLRLLHFLLLIATQDSLFLFEQQLFQ